MAKQKYWDGTQWVQIAPSMQEFESHKADDMPHQFTDTTDTKTYRYGFKTNTAKDGLVFVYEEVL
jgi:hypothetical protein